MTLVFWALVLIAALACLVKAADAFLNVAERLGLRYGLSPFIVGITIVAMGTSFPELLSGVTAVWLGSSEIAMGTAVGSNVTNILLILGASALIGRGLRVAHELVQVDLPFLFGSALLLALFAYDGTVERVEALFALAALSIYVVYAASTPEIPKTTVAAAATHAVPEAWVAPPEPDAARVPLDRRTVLTIPATLILIQIGAHYTVTAAVELSALVGLGSEIIAATVIAFGTSLPELSVSVQSARRGRPELAVGNVIGSNIFNALGVVGVAALVGPVLAPPDMRHFAIPGMLAVTVLCFFVLQEREMTRWDGWLLVVLYAAFTWQLYRIG